jgi:hypothetical protein
VVKGFLFQELFVLSFYVQAVDGFHYRALQKNNTANQNKYDQDFHKAPFFFL